MVNPSILVQIKLKFNSNKFLKFGKQWPEISWKIIKRKKFKESGLLQLNNSKAQKNWAGNQS